ncbi:hypothetical protein HY251_03610 [bacterium]|nr:hypothetical protein [bacterium]
MSADERAAGTANPASEAAATPTPEAPPAPSPGGLPGKRFLAWCSGALGVAAVLAVIGFFPGDREKTPSGASSRESSLLEASWDDGKAEVSRYDAERTIYKAPRKYELVSIFVKESFDPRTRTKPDAPRAGVLDAMKLMRVEDVPTGRLYRYRQTLTVRIARSEPARVLDAAFGSQEWCGNTSCLLVPRGASLVRSVHSYFDGEGDYEETLPGETWLEDQLPATLRALPLAVGFSLEVKLLPSIVSNRQPRGVVPLLSRLKVDGDETIETGVGSLACARVSVSREGETLSTLWIARDPPRALARYEAKDGGKGTLRSLERLVYWRDPVSDPEKPPR